MAEQANVYVKNVLQDHINVIRKLPDGSKDLDTAVTYGSEEKFFLPGTEVSLLIKAPEGVDIKECPVKVKTDVDLTVAYSRTDSSWSIQIVPNDLPLDVPTTVNINIGEDPQG